MGLTPKVYTSHVKVIVKFACSMVNFEPSWFRNLNHSLLYIKLYLGGSIILVTFVRSNTCQDVSLYYTIII